MKPRTTDTIRNLAEHFQRFAIEEMLKIGADQVTRYGFLIRLAECGRTLSNSPSDHYLSGETPAVSSMDLTFTQRMPVQDAHLKKGVEDFCKLIYIVHQSEDGEVRFANDYQQAFDPPLDRSETSKKPFTRFVDAGLKNYEVRFSQWLEKFQRSQAA